MNGPDIELGAEGGMRECENCRFLITDAGAETCSICGHPVGAPPPPPDGASDGAAAPAPPPPPSARAATGARPKMLAGIAAAAAIALGAAGWAIAGGSEDGTTPASASDDAVNAELYGLCADGEPMADAVAPAGDTFNPVAYALDRDNGNGFRRSGDVPDNWSGAIEGRDQSPSYGICGALTGTRDDLRVDCPGDGGTLTMVGAEWTLRLVDAATGEEVRAIDVSLGPGECPDTALFRDGEERPNEPGPEQLSEFADEVHPELRLVVDNAEAAALVCRGRPATFVDAQPYSPPPAITGEVVNAETKRVPVVAFDVADARTFNFDTTVLRTKDGDDPVQLVLCTSYGAVVAEVPCSYEGGVTAIVQVAPYRVDVYAADSGTLVQTVTGETSRTCPQYLVGQGSDDRTLSPRLPGREVEQALGLLTP